MQTINIEMHCHTVCSDGVLTTEQLIDKAVNSGLTHLAITDHDTTQAVVQAQQLAPCGLTIIPGIEISARAGERDVHMLGYFIDPNFDELLESCARQRELRAQRSITMVQKLHDAGYAISAEEFQASGVTINRSNVARALVEIGAVPTFDDAFKTLIGRGCPFYVERDDMSPDEAVALILRAGGMPVIAHPRHYHVEDLISGLAAQGMRGIECYHSEQSADDSRYLIEIAHELGLLVTGGSDFHGDTVHPSALGTNQPSQEDKMAFLQAGKEYGFEG